MSVIMLKGRSPDHHISAIKAGLEGCRVRGRARAAESRSALRRGARGALGAGPAPPNGRATHDAPPRPPPPRSLVGGEVVARASVRTFFYFNFC